MLSHLKCPDSLVVDGCGEDELAPVLNGYYMLTASNHKKPVYRKQSDRMTVMIYFWDDRDGPDVNGWWFGPEVGGDEVLAYCEDPSIVPPSSGWKLSNISWELDPALVVKASS